MRSKEHVGIPQSGTKELLFGVSTKIKIFLPKLKAPPKHLNVRNYKKFDLKAFKKDMINVPFDEIKYISSDANEMWNLWKRFFLDILNKQAPITNIQVKGSKIPYVTSELKAMIRQRDYLRAKANKTGSSVLRQAYGQVRAKVNHFDYIFSEKTIIPARLNNTSMTSKIHGKYSKVLLVLKLIKPLKLKRLALRVKNLLIKSKSQNYEMSTLSLLVISLPKVYNPVMSNL